MATEVELRFVHVDVLTLERLLADLGATLISRGPLREVRFAGLTGNPGEYVRARDDGHVVRLQHKAHDSEGHSAIEREVTLDPAVTLDAAVEFLAGLGLRYLLRVERLRAQWQLGPAIVTIDQLPRIPPHVEVEAESLAAVHAACALLGLEPRDHAGNGFAAIYRHYGVTLERGDIVFTPSSPPSQWVLDSDGHANHNGAHDA